MKIRNVLILLLSALLLFSCSQPMFDGGINQNIYPYLKFYVNEGECFVSVLEGANVVKLEIPAFLHSDNGKIPVVKFLGYERSEDAKSLKQLSIAGNTAIDTSFYQNAINLERITLTNPAENLVWSLPSSMPNREGYHFKGWFSGDEEVKDGDPITSSNAIVIPIYEKHTITYLTDADYHWLGCAVCNQILGEKEPHVFVGTGSNKHCDICGYGGGSGGNASGGFDIGYEDQTPNGEIKEDRNASDDTKWIVSFEFVDKQKEEYKATSIEWYVNNQKVDGANNSTLDFIGDKTLTYTVMCVVRNQYGVWSKSIRIA